MTPAQHAATVRSALKLDETFKGANAGPLAALDALQAQAEASWKLSSRLEDELGAMQERAEAAEAERDRLREIVRIREESQIPMVPRGAQEERDRLAARVSELEAAIAWANGEGDSDYSEQERKERGLGIYWWRAELSRRAALAGEQE